MPDAESQPALYTAAQTRVLDRCAIDEHGIPGISLMSRAGRAAFDHLLRAARRLRNPYCLWHRQQRRRWFHRARLARCSTASGHASGCSAMPQASVAMRCSRGRPRSRRRRDQAVRAASVRIRASSSMRCSAPVSAATCVSPASPPSMRSMPAACRCWRSIFRRAVQRYRPRARYGGTRADDSYLHWLETRFVHRRGADLLRRYWISPIWPYRRRLIAPLRQRARALRSMRPKESAAAATALRA